MVLKMIDNVDNGSLIRLHPTLCSYNSVLPASILYLFSKSSFVGLQYRWKTISSKTITFVSLNLDVAKCDLDLLFLFVSACATVRARVTKIYINLTFYKCWFFWFTLIRKVFKDDVRAGRNHRFFQFWYSLNLLKKNGSTDYRTSIQPSRYLFGS